MNNFSTLYPALLFPAIPLMMISFGNRYTSLAALIRKIHDLIVVNHLSRKNAKHYLDQIKILTQRLALVRASQSLSGLNEVATIQNNGNRTINSQIVKSVYLTRLSIFCF